MRCVIVRERTLLSYKWEMSAEFGARGLSCRRGHCNVLVISCVHSNVGVKKEAGNRNESSKEGKLQRFEEEGKKTKLGIS